MTKYVAHFMLHGIFGIFYRLYVHWSIDLVWLISKHVWDFCEEEDDRNDQAET
jgi:hypothetical protein